MINNESFNKLEAIVNESKPESFDYDTLNSNLETRSNNMSINKSNEVISQAKRLYGDDQESVFKTWMAGTRDFNLNKDTRKYYWDTYDSLTGDPKLSQESLREQTRGELKKFNNTFEKESYLRDNLDKWPEWLEKEYEPVLASFMMMNQSKDMLKGQMAYKEDTLNKVTKMLQSEDSDLDPDISVSDHVSDFKKFATLGLLDGAMITNGRLSVTNQDGEVEPAWSVSNASKVTGEESEENPAVSAFLRDSVQEEMTNAVSLKLDASRNKIKEQTKQLNTSVFYEMRQGNVPVDRWADMAALTEDPTISASDNLKFLFTEGIRGYIDTHPNITGQEINKFINLIVDKHANLITGEPKRG